MTHQQLWQQFTASHPLPDSSYEAWGFGSQADQLAALVQSGKKTATSSLALFYELEQEALPAVGAYSVILNSREEAVCIIRTTNVTLCPYSQVTAQHARKEGEGDGSLAFWRQEHQDFFTRELAQIGREFHPQMDVVCEEFERVWPL